eukprot:TRINITY_DN8001_c0_g1_i1.p1 TRINITY_DN8001_c0_g1~~TRINITY_DN8001_c0_g1_i1.p1  ORF type:complete len:513 (+),score=137.65 TRINITY_DN8001_c0_g1_i1:50-1588(+)
MFWEHWGIAPSHLETLMSSEDPSLTDVLNEDNLLQELTTGNHKVVQYISQTKILEQLLDMVMNESQNKDDIHKYKLPYVACEILVAEVFSIADTFYNNPSLLSTLFSFYDRDQLGSNLLATYTSRVATVMMQTRLSDCVTFLRTKGNFVDSMLRHSESTAAIELFIKLIECECASEGVHKISEWLLAERVIQKILGKFGPGQSESTYENCSGLLLTIINSASVHLNPLIFEMEKEENVQQMIDFVISAEDTNRMVSIANVLIGLLRRPPKEGSSVDQSMKFDEIPPIFRLCVKNVEKMIPLMKIVSKETKNYSDFPDPLKGSIYPIGPALGFKRLKLVEIIGALACTAYQELDRKVMETGAVPIVLDLFFEYQWNNILHLEVEIMVTFILEKTNDEFKEYLLKEAKLLDRIVFSSDQNESDISKNLPRRGNIGHLTSIAVEVSNVPNIDSLIEKTIGKHEAWTKYKDGILLETVEKFRTAYGGDEEETFGMEVHHNIDFDDDLEEEGDFEEE